MAGGMNDDSTPKGVGFGHLVCRIERYDIPFYSCVVLCHSSFPRIKCTFGRIV